MKNTKLKLFFFLFLLIIIIILANQKTTRYMGINYKVYEYQIPIYLKILDFYDRHYNYKFLVNKINRKLDNDEDIVINISKWIKKNIKKIPKGVDIIDNHPLTIVERRLGTDDQFSDILSVLLVYSNIDSFFISEFNQIWHPLTFFKINKIWSVIDPYYGIIFINNKNSIASIKDLKDGNWEISNLKFEKINNSNFNLVFEKKFENFDEVKKHYNKIFFTIKSETEINNTNVYFRGGRSYMQKPLSRLKYEIYNLIKKN